MQFLFYFLRLPVDETAPHHLSSAREAVNITSNKSPVCSRLLAVSLEALSESKLK